METQTEQSLWTGAEIQRMLDQEVRYKDWRFVVNERAIVTLDKYLAGVGASQEPDLRLRAEWVGADNETGAEEKQQSRWWPLSVHMVKTEIIQTAFLCVLKAEEHEIRETFKYLAGVRPFGTKWTAPFNSHIHINTLAEASEHVDVRVDVRPTAPENQRRE